MSSKYYPSWIYSYREDITRENMRQYDRMRDLLYKRLLELNPDYYSLNLRERHDLINQVENELNYHF